MLKPRLWRLALVLGLVASLALSGTAMATSKSTSATVWGTIIDWGTYTYFSASYTVTEVQDKQTYYWQIQNLGMDALVLNGRQCDSDNCQSWAYTTKVQYLNAAGSQVDVAYPPPGACHQVMHTSTDLVFQKCQSLDEIPLSATKVKFTWTVYVENIAGFRLSPWGISKTIALR